MLKYLILFVCSSIFAFVVGLLFTPKPDPKPKKKKKQQPVEQTRRHGTDAPTHLIMMGILD